MPDEGKADIRQVSVNKVVPVVKAPETIHETEFKPVPVEADSESAPKLVSTNAIIPDPSSQNRATSEDLPKITSDPE